MNVGFGSDVTIAELAKVVVSATGEYTFDTSKPDVVPQAWMDPGRLNQLAWSLLANLEA